jgi:hypothetical protein
MVDLARDGSKVFQHALPMPEDNFDTAVVVFSPGLELVSVGNFIALM